MAEELDFDFRGFDSTNLHKEPADNAPSASPESGNDAGKDKTNGKGKVKDKAKNSGDGKKSKKKAKHGDRPALFEPMVLRGMTIRNRVWLPPMDMYSVFERDGRPTQFHYQHYVSRALGGFGMVIAEATAVCPEGRISPYDTGLWNDSQIESWRWIAEGIKDAGATAAIQLNHAGRKGSTGCSGLGYIAATVPAEDGGWPTVAPSAIAYGRYAVPRALSIDEIHGITWAFAAAARRAVEAGFQVIEPHAAHGYLMSQCLDPLSNVREDEYGGDFEGRTRFLVETVDAVRSLIPQSVPLLVRVSATDWAAGGWDLDQTVRLAKVLKEHDVDLVDVSTGGIVSGVSVPVKPKYQDVPVTAVGLITKPKQAEHILEKGEADAVEIGRAALRDPYWPLRAAHKLGLPKDKAPYPMQYVRGAY